MIILILIYTGIGVLLVGGVIAGIQIGAKQEYRLLSKSFSGDKPARPKIAGSLALSLFVAVIGGLIVIAGISSTFKNLEGRPLTTMSSFLNQRVHLYEVIDDQLIFGQIEETKDSQKVTCRQVPLDAFHPVELHKISELPKPQDYFFSSTFHGIEVQTKPEEIPK